MVHTCSNLFDEQLFCVDLFGAMRSLCQWFVVGSLVALRVAVCYWRTFRSSTPHTYPQVYYTGLDSHKDTSDPGMSCAFQYSCMTNFSFLLSPSLPTCPLAGAELLTTYFSRGPSGSTTALPLLPHPPMLRLHPLTTLLQHCHPGGDLLNHWRVSPRRGAEEEEEEDRGRCDGGEEGGAYTFNVCDRVCACVCVSYCVHSVSL